MAIIHNRLPVSQVDDTEQVELLRKIERNTRLIGILMAFMFIGMVVGIVVLVAIATGTGAYTP